MGENVLLKEKENERLQYLSELLDYGVSLLQVLNRTELQLTQLQKFFLFNHIAIHNYSEAICLLCKDMRPHAADVILRSLFEAYTNNEYIKYGDSEKKIALFFKNGFEERRKVTRGFEEFIKRYPDKKNSLLVLTEKEIEKQKCFVNKSITTINKAANLLDKDRYFDIVSRSMAIDKNESNPLKRGNNELYYHLVFRNLSRSAHLNGWGLEDFIEKIDGKTIFILGQSEDISLVVEQTYAYYFMSLKTLFDKKVLIGNMNNKFLRYLHIMANG